MCRTLNICIQLGGKVKENQRFKSRPNIYALQIEVVTLLGIQLLHFTFHSAR
jgi:hypothetical protein